jgi:hypothetical protein
MIFWKRLIQIASAGIVILLLCAGMLMADSLPAGDANGDGSANVSDAVYIINYIFTGGPEPVNFSAADVINDCAINISDAVRIIGYVFDPEIDHLDKGCAHIETTGICMDYTQDNDSGYIVIEVVGSDLHIHHMDAYYNCGLEYNIDYNFAGNDITATEFDTGPPADCYCHFDHLKSVYYDLENGEYTVTVIGIESDTLVVEIIMVDDSFGIIGYFDSGCLPEDPDRTLNEISYSYSDGTLTMEHDSAIFNCAAVLIVKFEQAADTLRFYEINIADIYAWCICPFDISATVVGIPSGQYVAEIWAIEPLDNPPILTDRRILDL